MTLAALGLAGCGGSAGVARIPITSPAFGPGGPIPRAYTCDGRNVSPPLRWSDIPGDATQLSLAMTDSDAPGGSFIHLQLSGLSPRSTGLAAGETPTIGNSGTNSFGTTGYRGPCPPRGAKPHRYVITVTAVSSDQTVAIGTLTGTYSR